MAKKNLKMDKIFLDTAPFIYLIENNPVFAPKVKQFLANSIIDGHVFLTSVVSLSEFGVKPTKENQPKLIRKFEEFLEKLSIELFIIDKNAAIKSYELRAKYSFLKGMDAFQLAVAINENCRVFVTNDKDLKKVAEILVITIDDL
jgi:predicted nucleic acid-binding protein